MERLKASASHETVSFLRGPEEITSIRVWVSSQSQKQQGIVFMELGGSCTRLINFNPYLRTSRGSADDEILFHAFSGSVSPENTFLASISILMHMHADENFLSVKLATFGV